MYVTKYIRRGYQSRFFFSLGEHTQHNLSLNSSNLLRHRHQESKTFAFLANLEQLPLSMSKGHGEYGHEEQGRGQYNAPGQGLEEGLFKPSHPHPQPSSSQRTFAPLNRPPPRRVNHTYRDYSTFPLGEIPARKKSQTSFPSKLHQILSAHEHSHVSLEDQRST